MAKRKNPAAVSLGRKGGKVKTAKGFSSMDPERRSAIAKAAAKKRWAGKIETPLATAISLRKSDKLQDKRGGK